MKKSYALAVAAILIAMIPFAAWALFKRVRILAPEWVGDVVCVDSKICLDDPSNFGVASGLYQNAFAFVEKTVGAFHKPPRIVFCSTEKCFQSFGFASTAGDLGRWGIVVGPRGWRDYYVRHEMIHHRQSEELGFLASISKPTWFVEGMAYSLSEDPRRPLSGHWEAERARFETWYKGVAKESLWDAAKKL